jgi:hypothetical protein
MLLASKHADVQYLIYKALCTKLVRKLRTRLVPIFAMEFNCRRSQDLSIFVNIFEIYLVRQSL